jgi:urease accessory protein
MLQARTWLPRTQGSARIAFARRGEVTALAGLHQAGAARVRFPRAPDACPEAVLLNTAGGLTGGDRISIGIALGAGARATVITAAAEKIYRARDGEAAIDVGLELEPAARLAWLPQPTILFDGARLARCTQATLAGPSRLLAVEMLLFGRQAMGEEVRRGLIRDAWRLHRDGALVFADTFRLDGAIAGALDRAGTLDGGRALAMLLYAAPDAAGRLDEVRALLQGAGSTAGASVSNGVLIARAVARDGRALQADLAPVIERLDGQALPRLWQC